MLLIDPSLCSALPREAFCHSDVGLPEFRDYCDDYEEAVLGLPQSSLDKILRHLTRGFWGSPLTPESLHAVVERELTERDFELSGKVTRLIMLRAFAASLEAEGLPILPRTRRMLRWCDDAIPGVLALAIEDHWGVLETESA